MNRFKKINFFYFINLFKLYLLKIKFNKKNLKKILLFFYKFQIYVNNFFFINKFKIKKFI